MAKMLIRTNLKCKARIAVLIRIALFFGIPAFYYLFLRRPALAGDLADIPVGEGESYSSRHLLVLIEKDGRNCTPPAILEFPPDGFSRSQRQHGLIFVHCILALYCFLLLGTVCEQYFVPAIEIICDRMNMAPDIAGATFMAAASSSPELFINCVGTFVTEGDLGVGAVVGSAVFNVLAVPACCALFATQAIELDWWSISRDCLMYAVAVVALILTLLDDRVQWQEALLLVLMYTGYILAMVFNGRLGTFAKSGCCPYNKRKMYTETTPLLITDLSPEKNGSLPERRCDDVEQGQVLASETKRLNSTGSDDITSSLSSLWSWPSQKKSGFQKFLWVLTWPISLLLWATIPDCTRRSNLYFLTFVMCITWIGGVSYLVAWLITVIGDTLQVPDSITGLTVLAAGTSLPEAVSSVLVTNLGHGTMGLSNSIGSNTFDILLCLGLPWLIKALFYPSTPGHHWVSINSSGLSYSAISLLSTLFILYAALAINKFRLDWKIGVTCMIVYIGFLAFASLLELNVFFLVNLPVCPH